MFHSEFKTAMSCKGSFLLTFYWKIATFNFRFLLPWIIGSELWDSCQQVTMSCLETLVFGTRTLLWNGSNKTSKTSAVIQIRYEKPFGLLQQFHYHLSSRYKSGSPQNKCKILHCQRQHFQRQHFQIKQGCRVARWQYEKLTVYLNNFNRDSGTDERVKVRLVTIKIPGCPTSIK